MIFREYIKMRLKTPHDVNPKVYELYSRLNWPGDLETWADVRSWLRSVGVSWNDVDTAGRAWAAYKRHLKARTAFMPGRPSRAARIAS